MGKSSDTEDLVVIEHVSWFNSDAAKLRDQMDAEVGPRYADVETPEAGDALTVDPGAVILTVLARASDGRAIAHGAIRKHSEGLEAKRLFVRAESRGTGATVEIMSALETYARAQGADRLILQTGARQPEAVAFFERTGYSRIPVFQPYDAVPLSVCFEKRFTTTDPAH